MIHTAVIVAGVGQGHTQVGVDHDEGHTQGRIQGQAGLDHVLTHDHVHAQGHLDPTMCPIQRTKGRH